MGDWIQCKDRIPAIDGTYLVTAEQSYICCERRSLISYSVSVESEPVFQLGRETFTTVAELTISLDGHRLWKVCVENSLVECRDEYEKHADGTYLRVTAWQKLPEPYGRFAKEALNDGVEPGDVELAVTTMQRMRNGG